MPPRFGQCQPPVSAQGRLFRQNELRHAKPQNDHQCDILFMTVTLHFSPSLRHHPQCAPLDQMHL